MSICIDCICCIGGCCEQYYTIINNYSLYDIRFIRNKEGYPYCLWCAMHITFYESVEPIVLCMNCNTLVGHKKCFPLFCKNRICPYCNFNL